jgi:uncharacterized protein
MTNLIFSAIRNHDIARVNELIFRGVDINQYDDNGALTPLCLATEEAQLDILQLLLRSGSDANQLGWDEQYTPLSFAAKVGNLEILNILLNSGTSLNACGTEGTALNIAARSGNSQVLNLLLDRGADVNSTPMDLWIEGEDVEAETSDSLNLQSTWTPLMDAALHGHLTIVEILVNRGADPNLVDEDGEAAIQKASRNGHEKVFRLLLPLTNDPYQKQSAIQKINQYIAKQRRIFN